jgi:hypothetical protein
MGRALWAVALALGFVLLSVSTYAAIVGFTGVLSGARYLRCPWCHQHYLAGRGASWHRCPHGGPERVHQRVWARLHHRAAPTRAQTEYRGRSQDPGSIPGRHAAPRTTLLVDPNRPESHSNGQTATVITGREL